MPTVREATMRLLRDFGIDTIFGNPGSTELPMFRDFPEDFRYILGLQEAVVVGMADGYAQASGNAAFVNLHSSAGTGNALGNLFTAYKNQAPLVITAGQQARSILPFEPFLHAERATEFPRPFVKWANEPARAADVPLAIARAYYEAMTPPYGPTFVSVPADDWDEECDWVEARSFATANPGDAEAIARLAADLARSERPAFVVGAGAARDGAWDALVALAEQQTAAVYAGTYASRNVFPEDHPLFRGFLPAFLERQREMLTGHDLIVALGGPLNLYHAEGAGPHTPEDAKCWIVSDNPGGLAWAPQGDAILGNIRLIAGALVRAQAPADRSPPAPRASRVALDRSILDDRLALDRIAEALPWDAIVVEEAPSARPAMQERLWLNQPDSFFTTASGGLGYAMPAAVGVSLARPDRRVVAIIGDGSAMYSIQSLFSAYQLKTPITFIILNNRRYEALQGFGRIFGMQQVVGTNLSGLDFLSLAKGHGLPATRVEDAAALDCALAGSFAAQGPNLIEIIVE
ncbi:MAG: benzoylformate decarboxylase [Candidatus Andeanibacterium colombiense]|uniref:Benzoylformate decarboxylase n=1 Tax=Candidatus Andeanibacterium colombiense TaxID=3121345 RepID=A0AAJ6BP85_9SPHN|nr:MAG: benzoylformate decarboxylase [Sphingomonadaceae bacterium]